MNIGILVPIALIRRRNFIGFHSAVRLRACASVDSWDGELFRDRASVTKVHVVSFSTLGAETAKSYGTDPK
ncbi:MAG TPA: hypothetical protein VH143_24520 [Kofleriaceae bacterium]|jgi:hypothetical protein|nr:hypothetical protein [Kofleriaceae bacterium]